LLAGRYRHGPATTVKTGAQSNGLTVLVPRIAEIWYAPAE
jgi:hypothetical protein